MAYFLDYNQDNQKNKVKILTLLLWSFLLQYLQNQVSEVMYLTTLGTAAFTVGFCPYLLPTKFQSFYCQEVLLAIQDIVTHFNLLLSG